MKFFFWTIIQIYLLLTSENKMTIPYNPARVNPKKRLIKTSEMRIDELNNPQGHNIDKKAYNRDLQEISNYIDNTRIYLQRIKTKCNQLIDKTLDNAECLHIFANQNEVDIRILSDKPSDFLQKAYTQQTFHSDEKDNINREQAYIEAGTKFSRYCQDHKNDLTDNEKMFNDFGTVIAAINSAISQMDRTESDINAISVSSNNDDYMKTFLNVKPIATFIQILTDEVADKKPNVLNSKGGILANAYDDLLAMIEKFSAFCSVLFKRRYESVSNEEKDTEMVSEKRERKNI